MSSFFFAITRYFLMLGVFVGLFGGQRVGHFFLGGHFGEIGPFLAHFRPKGSNREREREYILLLGFEAAGMAPWDAAHTIHPLAGQGINLGIGDVQELAQTIATAHAAGAPLGELAPF